MSREIDDGPAGISPIAPAIAFDDWSEMPLLNGGRVSKAEPAPGTQIKFAESDDPFRPNNMTRDQEWEYDHGMTRDEQFWSGTKVGRERDEYFGMSHDERAKH